MNFKEIAEHLHKYEGWDYRAALKEAEKRVKKSVKSVERKGGFFLE